MLSKPIPIVKNITFVQRRSFASKNVGGGGGVGGGAFKGASENTSTTTSQTSNSPNFGTSNNSGGRFSGSPNQGASNTASPASSSKATSTSGTSQATGTGSSAVGKNHKGGVQPQDDSSMANNKSNEANPSGSGSGFSSFLKSAFGGGVAKDGTTENLSTESSNLNRGSIPTNEGATFTQDTGKDPAVKASIKDRQGSGSVAPTTGQSSSSSSHSTSSSKSSSASTGFSSGGSQVNRNTVGTAHSLETVPMSADLVQARSSLQFDSVAIRYGYLLWSTYKDANALEQLDEDLEKFYNLIGENETLAKVFDNSELMSESSREAALERFLEKGAQIDPKMIAFLRTVGEMRRLSDLTNILGAIHEIREKVERGVHTALVTSAKPLSDSDRESIRNTIMSTFSPKGEVKIEEEIKPELGGGFEIYYDGKYHLDNTQRSLVSELDEDINSAITNFMGKRS